MTDEEQEAHFRERGMIPGTTEVTFVKFGKNGKPPTITIVDSAPRKKRKKKETVYRLLYNISQANEGLVFATPKEAIRISRIHNALCNLKTWKEFRSAMPQDDYSDLLRSNFDEQGEPRPKQTDEFDYGMIYGYEDGDYPEWLQQYMTRVLPDEIIEKYATHEDTFLNGQYYHIDPIHLPEIKAKLEAMGFVVEDGTHMSFF